jgi:MFS family permease
MSSPTPASSLPKHYKWTVVGMLWFVCFFNYADRQMISSVFPKLKEEFGFNPVQLGLIGSAFAWVYAAAAPLAGFIADRVPRRHLILGGCVFWSGVAMMTGWCRALWQFVTVRALEGFGETFYFPATMSLVGDYHDGRTRSRAFSFHQSSVYAGTIAGSWAGAWFAEVHGWRSGFYLFGGLGMVLALVLYRFLREPVRGANAGVAAAAVPALPPLGVAAAAREIFRRPSALLLMGAFLGANFVATIFLTWTPTFLVEKFGFKLTAAGLSGSVFIHLASAASVPLGGLLADRLARRFPGGRMLVQAAGLLVGAAFVGIVGLTSSTTTLLAAMACFGVCKGLYDSNIFAALFDVIEPRARATSVGIMNAVGWGGGALGPLAVGIATQYGRHTKEVDNMSEAIAFGAVIYLGAAALLLIAALGFARRDVVGSGNPVGVES